MSQKVTQIPSSRIKGKGCRRTQCTPTDSPSSGDQDEQKSVPVRRSHLKERPGALKAEVLRLGKELENSPNHAPRNPTKGCHLFILPRQDIKGKNNKSKPPTVYHDFIHLLSSHRGHFNDKR